MLNHFGHEKTDREICSDEIADDDGDGQSRAGGYCKTYLYNVKPIHTHYHHIIQLNYMLRVIQKANIKQNRLMTVRGESEKQGQSSFTYIHS